MTRFSGNEQKYINQVLAGESWSSTGGSWCHNLEQEFAKKWGMKYAVAFNSGTSTLHAALVALGVGPGDEVITPALAPFMCTSCILQAGATPVYADVDEFSFCIDSLDIKKKITPRTKAVIAVHLYGMPCDMDAILALGIPVIEDCAQAVLSYYKGRLCGAMGVFGSFSFENTKHISCGEGGLLVTNDEKMAEKVRKFGGHGFKNLTASEGRVKLNASVFQSPDYKRHDSVGYNYRLSEFQAAIALAQLERVDELVKVRQESTLILAESLFNDDFNVIIQSFGIDDAIGCDNSVYTFAVRYLGDWHQFYNKFVELGGDGFYACWSLPWMESLSFIHPELNCPVAERIQPQIMQFKTSYWDIEQAKKQAEILKETIKWITENQAISHK